MDRRVRHQHRCKCQGVDWFESKEMGNACSILLRGHLFWAVWAG